MIKLSRSIGRFLTKWPDGWLLSRRRFDLRSCDGSIVATLKIFAKGHKLCCFAGAYLMVPTSGLKDPTGGPFGWAKGSCGKLQFISAISVVHARRGGTFRGIVVRSLIFKGSVFTDLCRIGPRNGINRGSLGEECRRLRGSSRSHLSGPLGCHPNELPRVDGKWAKFPGKQHVKRSTSAFQFPQVVVFT